MVLVQAILEAGVMDETMGGGDKDGGDDGGGDGSGGGRSSVEPAKRQRG